MALYIETYWNTRSILLFWVRVGKFLFLWGILVVSLAVPTSVLQPHRLPYMFTWHLCPQCTLLIQVCTFYPLRIYFWAKWLHLLIPPSRMVLWCDLLLIQSWVVQDADHWACVVDWIKEKWGPWIERSHMCEPMYLEWKNVKTNLTSHMLT